jgi:flagellar biosynthesis chaperone FliJ
MNNQRRKAIQEVMEQLSAPLDTITDLKEQLEAIMDEEQEYYDNMPESLQGGEKGDMAQEAIDQISEAVSTLDEICSSIEEVSNFSVE